MFLFGLFLLNGIFFVVKNFEFFSVFCCCCGGKNAAGLVFCQNKTWTNAFNFSSALWLLCLFTGEYTLREQI